jgi:ABC-type multidrug transport system fused ATPase/permease subunit
VLEDGVIREIGSHDELLQQNGYYAKMAAMVENSRAAA